MRRMFVSLGVVLVTLHVLAMTVLPFVTIPAAHASGFASHEAQLVPFASADLQATIYALHPRAEGRWGAVHILDRSCRETAPIIAHLLSRSALASVDELVVILDRQGVMTRDDVALVHAGFRVRIATGLHTAGLPLDVAPLLAIARPDGTLAFVGGHRRPLQLGDAIPLDRRARAFARVSTSDDQDRPAAGELVDARIIAEAISTGGTGEQIPIHACTTLTEQPEVSRRLAAFGP